MNLRAIIAVSVVALTVVACGRQESSPDPAGTWVGTITTEGNVTTVINESGSVWGGTATLVEEASIGVESGPDEYMFGYINSIYATESRILVVDEIVSIVRMYDRSGEFFFNVGGAGQGPGEYTRPTIATMDADGHIFVFDSRARRLTEYSPSGEYVTSWPISNFGCCAWNMHPQPEGGLWVPVVERSRETPRPRYGAQLYDEEGAFGEPTWLPEIDFDEPTFEANGNDIPTPFSPRIVWHPTPAGGIIVGASDRYRFEVLYVDGSKLAVERFWEPTPIDPDEWEWQRKATVGVWRSRLEGWNWDGAEMPTHKAAYTSLLATVSGDIWVTREIGSRRLTDCTDDPLEASYAGERSIRRCYEPVYSIDVFDAGGRYMGAVDSPADLRPFGMYINGDSVLGFTQDELGTVGVKRYRLVLPGEEER